MAWPHRALVAFNDSHVIFTRQSPTILIRLQDQTHVAGLPILSTVEDHPMSNDSYGQFCPVAKACEVLEPRWTLLILCEMWSGSTRFNEIRRGVPGMSPTLLSKRLKEMEAHSLIHRSENRAGGDITYTTTAIAADLEPIVYALGKWAHRNIDVEVTLEHLDARLLMWNIRRKIKTDNWSDKRRTVVQFTYPELPSSDQNYWVIAKPGAPVDLCLMDPGHDVDLYVSAELKAMTSAWIGLSSFEGEIARNRISLIGDKSLAATLTQWLGRSSFAAE